MAQNGISINVLANVREAVRGVGDVADVVDELGDRLHDLSKEGGDSTDRMERDFRDLSRTADRESDELRRKFKQAYKDVKRASDDTRDVAVKNTRKMGDQASEVGGEIRQNLGEGIANAARGDFESLADVVGDTLGGVTAGIGGIGTAALGIAGAAGLGAIVNAFKLIQEEENASKERVGEWAQAYLDGSGKIVGAAYVVAEVQDIATDPERYQKAKDAARDWGVDVQTAMLAMAGDGTALAVVQDTLAEKTEKYQKSIEGVIREGEGYAASTGELTQEQVKLRDEVSRGNQALNKQTDEMTEGQKRADNAAGALYRYASQVGTATKETDDLGNAIVTLPDGKEIVVDAKTKRAYEDLDALERKKLNEKKLPVGVRDNTRREVDRIVSRIANTRVNITVGAKSGALGGGAIGRSYGAKGQLG